MKIQIEKGSVAPGDVSQYHLVTNHLIDPTSQCDKVIQYAEKRHLMTLLVSGAMQRSETVSGYIPEGGNTVSTKIKPIPEAELVNGNQWEYEVMGRIQKSAEILGSADVGVSTVATATEGSEFKLHLRDNYIQHGMNVTFYGGYQARVSSPPVRVGGEKWLYTFKGFPGETFSWTTWIAGQSGTKTCFGGYTSYGERSMRGYAAFHFPDKFINHTTVQRVSFSLSGHANVNQVRWYTLGDKKGFVYEAEAQLRAQFLLQDEYQKWWGESTMRDVYGNLLARPSQYEDDGEPIFAGDGLIEQIRGANDMEASNADGTFTYDDLSDMVIELKKRKNMIEGNKWIVATGADGMANADSVIASRLSASTPIIQNVPNGGMPGGAEPNVGYNFKTLNVAGQQITFVENPMMDDVMKFPRRLSNGKLAMSNTLYFLDMAVDEANKQNIEIRAAGRNGVNRNVVYLWEQGMTGEGKATTPVDAKSFHILKDNMLVAYRTISMGIMEPPATA
jgi:hypothetical protein